MAHHRTPTVLQKVQRTLVYKNKKIKNKMYNDYWMKKYEVNVLVSQHSTLLYFVKILFH